VARVSAYLNAERVSLDQAMKIQGMLEHVTFILTAGSSYLLSLSWAVKSFKGVSNVTSTSIIMLQEMYGLICIGGMPSCQSKAFLLLPHLHLDLDMWVDASMSWSIGMVVQGFWAAWQHLWGWKASDCNIG